MNRPPISVAAPVTQAIERVKQVLFRPFDLSRWFVIGFCAWLAELGRRGGGFNFNFNPGRTEHIDLQSAAERARDYVMANLYWLIPIAAVMVVVMICLGVLVTWLSSRGQFMFLHCVALNRAEVAVPWTRFRRQGNSLFWFRLALAAINLVLVLPIVGLAGIRAYRMAVAGAWSPGGVLILIGLGLFVLAVGVACGLVHKLTIDFVVPLMFLRGKSCPAGWRELLPLLANHAGSFVLYILFQIVLVIGLGVIVLAAILLTCCLAACLLILPYLGTVALLPLLVFKRAYSLHYFSQYGPEFDVFAPSAPPPLAPLPVSGPAPGV